MNALVPVNVLSSSQGASVERPPLGSMFQKLLRVTFLALEFYVGKKVEAYPPVRAVQFTTEPMAMLAVPKSLPQRWQVTSTGSTGGELSRSISSEVVTTRQLAM